MYVCDVYTHTVYLSNSMDVTRGEHSRSYARQFFNFKKKRYDNKKAMRQLQKTKKERI